MATNIRCVVAARALLLPNGAKMLLRIASGTVNNVQKCDPLSENLAHLAFYENRNKTKNRCIDVYLCSSEKWKRSVAWFLSYRAKHIVDAECNFSRKCDVFTLLNCNVSVY